MMVHTRTVYMHVIVSVSVCVGWSVVPFWACICAWCMWSNGIVGPMFCTFVVPFLFLFFSVWTKRKDEKIVRYINCVQTDACMALCMNVCNVRFSFSPLSLYSTHYWWLHQRLESKFPRKDDKLISDILILIHYFFTVQIFSVLISIWMDLMHLNEVARMRESLFFESYHFFSFLQCICHLHVCERACVHCAYMRALDAYIWIRPYRLVLLFR